MESTLGVSPDANSQSQLNVELLPPAFPSSSSLTLPSFASIPLTSSEARPSVLHSRLRTSYPQTCRCPQTSASRKPPCNTPQRQCPSRPRSNPLPRCQDLLQSVPPYCPSVPPTALNMCPLQSEVSLPFPVGACPAYSIPGPPLRLSPCCRTSHCSRLKARLLHEAFIKAIGCSILEKGRWS